MTGLDYEKLMALPTQRVCQTYSKRDTMLYALGVGVGLCAADDPDQLRYVYEEGLVALPTMAATLATETPLLSRPEYGIDWDKVVFGEQALDLFQPLPAEGRVVSETAIEDIYDKGAETGAVMYLIRKLFNQANGDHVATLRVGFFLRGNGGFGGKPRGRLPQETPVPARTPDLTVDRTTRPEQALIYRLSGDYFPLHVSPDFARRAGFPKPILHGLATYGIAAHAALTELCGNDATLFRGYRARFSSPVFPGETLRVEMWGDTGGAYLQVRVVERDVIVIKHGRFDYRS